MKKFIVAAMLVLGATSAFAGDSDALKAVLSAKKYSEAKELVKQNLASMASDAERAKAYNYLVKLSMDAFNKESAKELEDQIKKTTTADKETMYKNAYNALASAIECYKYDQLPDAKGKVKPKYNGNKDLVGQPVSSSLMPVRMLPRRISQRTCSSTGVSSSIQRMLLSSILR